MKHMDYEMIRPLYEIEENFEWRKWAKEIPYVTFPTNWMVKAIPPFGTGIIRYNITTLKMGNDCISIYLDCYDRAGCVGEPYWEIYPIDGDCERFMMNDTDGLLGGITRAIAEIEKGKNANET